MTDFTILPTDEALRLHYTADRTADADAFYSRALIWLNVVGYGTVALYFCYLLGYSIGNY